MTLEVRSESPCLMECDMICTSAWLAVGEHHWSASHCSVPEGHLCHLFLTRNNWSHVHCYSPWMVTNETSYIAKQQAPKILHNFTHNLGCDICSHHNSVAVNTLCQCASSCCCFKTHTAFISRVRQSKKKVMCSFTTSETTHPMTQHHTPKDFTSSTGILNLQPDSTVPSEEYVQCYHLMVHDSIIMHPLHNVHENNA